MNSRDLGDMLLPMVWNRHLLIIFSLVGSMVPCQPAIAQDDLDDDEPVLSHATLEVGNTSSGSRSFTVEADLGLKSGDRLGLVAGSSRTKTQADDLNTTTLRASYQKDPSSLWSFGGSLENWGARGKLTTNGARANLVWSPGDWELMVEPEVKAISWWVQTRANTRYNSTGSGVRGKVSYFGIKNLRIAAVGAGYQYSANLDSAFDSGFFSDEALDLAAGFPKNYAEVDASYRLGMGFVGAGLNSTTYQYQDSKATTSFLRAGYDFTDSWGMSVEGGKTDSDASVTPSTYGHLSATYTW